MTRDEFDNRLRTTLYTASVNARYHHILAWRWGCADRAIRILVGVLAVGGAIFAVPKLDSPWLGFWVALLSAVAAIVLNILPVGDWEKRHWEMFQRWSDVGRNAAAENFKIGHLDGPPSEARVERLQDLAAEMESLHALETAPWNHLLNRCQEDENEREWGKGIRTFEQAEAECDRRLARYAATLASEASEASEEGVG